MTLWLAKAIPTDCQNSCFSHKNELLLYANCSKTENNTYKIYVFLKKFCFLCSFSWTQAFLRRSAWCLGTRKVSWLWPTRTWSAALTVPSRSCRPLHPALCSAAFRPGRVELPGPGAHFCTTVEDQAQRDDISMAKAAGQGFVNLSHIHWPCPPGRLF